MWLTLAQSVWLGRVLSGRRKCYGGMKDCSQRFTSRQRVSILTIHGKGCHKLWTYVYSSQDERCIQNLTAPIQFMVPFEMWGAIYDSNKSHLFKHLNLLSILNTTLKRWLICHNLDNQLIKKISYMSAIYSCKTNQRPWKVWNALDLYVRF